MNSPGLLDKADLWLLDRVHKGALRFRKLTGYDNFTVGSYFGNFGTFLFVTRTCFLFLFLQDLDFWFGSLAFFVLYGHMTHELHGSELRCLPGKRNPNRGKFRVQLPRMLLLLFVAIWFIPLYSLTKQHVFRLILHLVTLVECLSMLLFVYLFSVEPYQVEDSA